MWPMGPSGLNSGMGNSQYSIGSVSSRNPFAFLLPSLQAANERISARIQTLQGNDLHVPITDVY